MGQPKGWTKFDAQANVEEASDYFLNIYTDQVETLQAAMTQDGKQYRVAGEVKNVGAQTLERVIVMVGLYDAAGRLVGAADGTAEINRVQPGAISPFSVDGIQVVAPPATYRVWLSGRISAIRFGAQRRFRTHPRLKRRGFAWSRSKCRTKRRRPADR